MRRLGWFLVGAAGATGALLASPGLYGRLREAVGGGDPWTEFEPEAEADYPPPREAEPVVAAEPEPEAAAEAEGGDVYETVVWPVPAPPAEEAEPAAEDEEEADDDTAEISATPLTPAPPPEDTEATDLRSRIESSRQRLHRKAQGGGDEADEPGADEPDPGA